MIICLSAEKNLADPNRLEFCAEVKCVDVILLQLNGSCRDGARRGTGEVEAPPDIC